MLGKSTATTQGRPGPIRRLLRLLRFYVGIPALVIYIFVFALFWRPLAVYIFGVAEYLKTLPVPTWVPEMGFNILANVLSAIVIAIVVWFALLNRRLQSIAGTYSASDITSASTPVTWGSVTLRYELLPTGLFQPQFRCRLKTADGVVLEGCAVWTKDQYLVGHYQEVGHLARRRAGAFVMQLDGGGSTFTGKFAYIDPNTRDPAVGEAKWERDGSA